MAAQLQENKLEVEGPLETPAFTRKEEDDFELEKDNMVQMNNMSTREKAHQSKRQMNKSMKVLIPKQQRLS